MSYDRRSAGSGPQTLAPGGGPINLGGGDFTVPDSVKGIVVTSAGDVVFRALNGSADITMAGLPAGYVLPWHCSHIRKSGTTAALATAEG